MLIFPEIDPVLISFGSVKIYWYAFAYVITIIISYIFLKQQNKKLQILNEQQIDDLSTYLVLNMLIGGRMGYIIFYDLQFYIQNPEKILKIWQGGMSWHGAFLAIFFTIYFFCKRNKIVFWKISDVIVYTIPIGFFLGRIANFINQELIGRPVNQNFPLAIIFPADSMQIPRHPSQLYEAFGEGFILFLCVNLIAKFFPNKQGLNSIIFIINYLIIRFICEFFRQPDSQIGFVFHYFTLGQILNILILIAIFSYFIYKINIKKKEKFCII